MILSDWLKGEFKYDADGQLIWLVMPNGYHQRIADVRAWGAIVNLFKVKETFDNDGAVKFQDELGEWISAALNEKLAQQEPEPEKRESAVLVGHLNREYGYKYFYPAKIGTEVFEENNRYWFWIVPADRRVDLTKQMFYRGALRLHIDFLQPVKDSVTAIDNHAECKECGKQNSENCSTCDVINPQYH